MGEEIMKKETNTKENRKFMNRPSENNEIREPLIGVVIDCIKLNIRKRPYLDAEILGELVVGSKVKILDDISRNNKVFYHVCTMDGIDGFCMKQYIKTTN